MYTNFFKEFTLFFILFLLEANMQFMQLFFEINFDTF